MAVDITTDWSGLALVITATGGAIAIVINAFKTSRKVDATHKVADATHKLAVEIDRAVNTKGPGEQTIGEEVSDLHSDRPQK